MMFSQGGRFKMDRPFLFLKRHGKRYHAFKTVPIFASLDDKLKRAIVRPNLLQGQGNARQPMAIKYFLVAILFVLFDVEVIFFYPYAVNFRELGWQGFMAVLMFVSLFIIGFVYIIKKGALNWED